MSLSLKAPYCSACATPVDDGGLIRQLPDLMEISAAAPISVRGVCHHCPHCCGAKKRWAHLDEA